MSSLDSLPTDGRKPEPLLSVSSQRFTQLPLQYPGLQAAYDEHEALFWTAKEVDYVADMKDWLSLQDDERRFIELILAFFASADGIVLENIMTNFSNEVTAPEARNFYAFQAMIENVHAMVYANLLDTYVTDRDRKAELFQGIDLIPCITKKAKWALKWMDPALHFEERLVAFAAVEGIFFSGSFCAIFWLKDRGLMTKALGFSNELIARDEGLHTKFATLVYALLKNKMSEKRMKELIHEAVEIEEAFICESLNCDLIGMNSRLMKSYIRFTADRLLVQLGGDPIYGDDCPFPFMSRINVNGKTNFFEKRNSDYHHATVSSADWSNINDFTFT